MATSLISFPSIGPETVNEVKAPARLGTDCFDLTLCKDRDRWNQACGARRFIASAPSHDEAILSITKHYGDLSSLKNAERLLLSSSRRVLGEGCCPEGEPDEFNE